LGEGLILCSEEGLLLVLSWSRVQIISDEKIISCEFSEGSYSISSCNPEQQRATHLALWLHELGSL
jgi:hypothetical protein